MNTIIVLSGVKVNDSTVHAFANDNAYVSFVMDNLDVIARRLNAPMFDVLDILDTDAATAKGVTVNRIPLQG